MQLPPQFADRMKSLLGADYTDFCHALEKESDVKGLRVNTHKLSVEALCANMFAPLTAIPYVEGGFIVPSDADAGKHPFHHAGAYYMQDPGAMSAVASIPSDFWKEDGLCVLDLCAAPGGKTTQLATLVHERGGVVLANEYVSARSRILAGNIERMGLDNVAVTSTNAARLASWYPECFDLVVVDAPCSGEGMFRKNELALSEWSPENVTMCAARQIEILEEAVKCVSPSGLLLYSTCTYSTQENEEVVARFLCSHPDFSLIPVAEAVRQSTADGIAGEWEANGNDLSLCRRFYPHRCAGEGQFVSLMKRMGTGTRKSPVLPVMPVPRREDIKSAQDFLHETLGELSAHPILIRDQISLFPQGERLGFRVPAQAVSVGVPIGEVRKGRILPHHHFFMTYGKRFYSKCILDPVDPRVAKYLGGEEIEADGTLKGYTAVLLLCGEAAIPLGGGKAAGGRLKNYYPKGLRI